MADKKKEQGTGVKPKGVRLPYHRPSIKHTDKKKEDNKKKGRKKPKEDE